MASTYSPLLRLEMIAAGEQAGLWGNTTNSNLGTLLEQAIAGVTFISLPAGTSYTLSAMNGALDEARAAVLVFTGNPGASCAIVVPLLQKVYFLRNATSHTLTAKTSSQVGGVEITAGNTIPVFCDGTNVYPGITPNALGAPTTAGGGATGTWGISITGNARTVTDGVYTTNLTTGPTPANKVPKYNAKGILGVGVEPAGDWSGSSAYAYGFEFGDLGALATSLGTAGAEFWPITARTTLFHNGYVNADGSVRNKVSGNGFGGGVSAMELYSRRIIFAFSGAQPTSAGQLAPLGGTHTFSSDGSATFTGTLTQSSDARLKTNVKPILGAMTKVMKLKGYTFNRTDENQDPNKVHMGLIAQEVQEVVPEVVGDPNDDGYLAVAYQNLVPLLIEALKSQERSITKLQERLRKLEALAHTHG